MMINGRWHSALVWGIIEHGGECGKWWNINSAHLNELLIMLAIFCLALQIPLSNLLHPFLHPALYPCRLILMDSFKLPWFRVPTLIWPMRNTSRQLEGWESEVWIFTSPASSLKHHHGRLCPSPMLTARSDRLLHVVLTFWVPGLFLLLVPSRLQLSLRLPGTSLCGFPTHCLHICKQSYY